MSDCKARNNSHFHVPLIFRSLLSQPVTEIFFSLFDNFSHLRKLRKSHHTTRTATRFVRSTKLSSVRRGYYLDGWPISNTPCCNIPFFPFPFQGDIKDCRTAILVKCRFPLFIKFLYLISPWPHLCVFICIMIIWINGGTRRSNYPQFSGLELFENSYSSSILWLSVSVSVSSFSFQSSMVNPIWAGIFGKRAI